MPALGAMYGGKDLSGLYLDHSGDRKIAASYLDFGNSGRNVAFRHESGQPHNANSVHLVHCYVAAGIVIQQSV